MKFSFNELFDSTILVPVEDSNDDENDFTAYDIDENFIVQSKCIVETVFVCKESGNVKLYFDESSSYTLQEVLKDQRNDKLFTVKELKLVSTLPSNTKVCY